MTSGTVSVLLGNGDGSFQGQRTLEAGRTPDSVAVGDFNGDGVPDLAVTTLNFPNVSVFLGNGDGSFRAPRNFLLGPEAIPMSVTVGDFNGDGRLDLAVTSIGFTNGITVLLGNGDGTFQAPRTFALGRSAGSIAVGDFNLDGLPDLAAVYLDPISYNGGVSVLLGNGDGGFLPPRNFPAGTVDPFGALAVGDFNGDGRPDVALVNYPSNNVSVLINHSPE
jgi:hypothetical protein